MGSIVSSVAGMAGSLLGASAQASAAKKAASASSKGAAQANALLKSMYDTTREDQAPYRQAGYNALAKMQEPGYYDTFEYSDMTADPGYAFRLSEGQQAIDRSAAAKTGLQSGAALKAATTYGQNMASQEYGNAFGRYMQQKTQNFNQLSSLAGLGQSANQSTAAAGSTYAGNAAGNITGNAANQGNAALAQGNAWASAYQGIGNALGGSGLGSFWGGTPAVNYGAESGGLSGLSNYGGNLVAGWGR